MTISKISNTVGHHISKIFDILIYLQFRLSMNTMILVTTDNALMKPPDKCVGLGRP